MKDLLRAVLQRLGLHLTQNMRLDRDAIRILRAVLTAQDQGVDVGCHKGEIMDLMIRYAPEGKHYGFEPLPHLYQHLREKYRDDSVVLYPYALYDEVGETSFQYVKNAPAYSGIRRREYDRADAQVDTIRVDMRRLDDLIPESENIALLKIDVEGAEFHVLRGAERILRRCHPVLIFEYGLGAADHYGSDPDRLYDYLSGLEYAIYKVQDYFTPDATLSKSEFIQCYETNSDFYFVATRL